MGTLTNIEVALQTKLNSISGAPYIAWEADYRYNPVIGTPFWAPSHIPLKSDLVSAGSLQQHRGIFRVHVYVPANKGTGTLIGYLDSIYAAYNTVAPLVANTTRVDILGAGRGGEVIRQDSWIIEYIDINYSCYAY